MQLKSIITLVIRCSLKIHQLFRLKESEEGLEVRVKIGLAAGHISMLVFGDEARDFFLVTGQTVDDVRRAQNLAQVNDVVLSPNCWQLCDRSLVEIERIPDARAVKVCGRCRLRELRCSVPGTTCPQSPWGGGGLGRTLRASACYILAR
ncbi:adenylate cyclase type 10-like [Saccopteryx leptura]|uniref:adenylate cyclase type 10-like n=1 Tax=Saccopteryx leptura TaxID=249018 RepID=UPI00339CD8C9